MRLIIDSEYFGDINYYYHLGAVTHIEFDIYDGYRKISFRNRTILSGAEGPIVLSIPIVGGRAVKGPMLEVKVDNRSNWQRNHWRTIFSCYNRSPWFEYYRDELESLFSLPVDYLFEWNMKTVQWVLPKLEFDLSVGFTRGFEKSYDEPGVIDLRNRFFPRERELNAPPVRYRQVFEDRIGFIPNLSVLDLLFCEGPAAGRLLKQAHGG